MECSQAFENIILVLKRFNSHKSPENCETLKLEGKCSVKLAGKRRATSAIVDTEQSRKSSPKTTPGISIKPSGKT